MKTYGWEEVQIHASLSLALDAGEWSASRPGRFTPQRKRAPDTHRIGGWVGSRAGPEEVAMRRIPASGGKRIPVVQPIDKTCT
jgi:hypothetical protein